MAAPQVLPVAGPLEHILITHGSLQTTVRGTVVLTAVGKDAEGRDMDINPTWKCDSEGELIPTVSKTVTFKALKRGIGNIEVFQGGVSATTQVEEIK